MRFKHSAAALLLVMFAGLGRARGQTITDFNPKYGAPGDALIITGSGFSLGTMAVRFWNNQVASRYVTDDSHITVLVPAGATTGPISVQRNSNTPVSSSALYTIIGNGPCITGFVPALGAVGDTVYVNGVHFLGATQVKFGNTSAGFTMNSDGTQIITTVPGGATNGPIKVTTPTGTSNSPSAFTVIGPGPYISGFTPSTYSGLPVFINGRFFTGATAVRFNGTNAAFFTPTMDTQIQATPQANVSTGPITVVTALGTNTTATNFYVPPAITGFAPTTGRSGTNVILTGRNFTGATAVTFNWQPALFTVNSLTQIVATVPEGASTGPIMVTAPGGAFPTSSNFVVPPTISGFSPAFGPVGTSVTISGANFNEGTTVVRFGGVAAASPTNITFSQLTAVVPNGATNAPISVTTTNGTATSAQMFYLPPAITGFTPTNSAPGSTVTLTGQNLLGATGVSFNTTPASFIPPTDNTTIQAVVPFGFTTGPISVVTPGGATNSGGRLFYAPPEITGFTPTHGLPGTNVVLSGANFLGATVVRFGGLVASFTPPTNNTALVATVPANATNGPITVVAPAGTNTSTSVFTLDYTADLSVSVTEAPDPVSVGSNLVYSITVLNKGPFAAPGAMLSNTLPASVQLKTVTSTLGTVNGSGNPVTVSFGSLNNGASATVTLTVAPQVVGWLTNLAALSSDHPDPSGANNLAATPTLVQPLPLLSIHRPQADRVRVSWPVALSNFALQYRPAFSATDSWQNVTTAVNSLGEENVVTETNSQPARFYRLSK